MADRDEVPDLIGEAGRIGGATRSKALRVLYAGSGRPCRPERLGWVLPHLLARGARPDQPDRLGQRM
ncbi:hypothetical protein [Actinoplanes sp. NPDC051411]|uniref:hypothetical protein n=1 Tax=Actinoplanes sp. NPDC051411 TaxID=3155522 RepID=UPI003419811D